MNIEQLSLTLCKCESVMNISKKVSHWEFLGYSEINGRMKFRSEERLW